MSKTKEKKFWAMTLDLVDGPYMSVGEARDKAEKMAVNNEGERVVVVMTVAACCTVEKIEWEDIQ